MRHLVIAQWHFSLPKNGFMNERNEKQAVPGWGNEDVYTRSSRQNCDPRAGHKCEGQNTPLTMDWCKHINSVCRNAGLAFWVCETLWDYIYIYVYIKSPWSAFKKLSSRLWHVLHAARACTCFISLNLQKFWELCFLLPATGAAIIYGSTMGASVIHHRSLQAAGHA